MSSVVLVLSGVLQSWGTTTIGHARATNSYPTKSAIVGLVANALGRERTDTISDLAKLSFGVRIDMAGVVQRDYHTVSIITQPTKGDRVNRITERYYLADAVFVVVLSGTDNELIKQIGEALQRPARPLFLGRKSCPPIRPTFHSYSDLGVQETLAAVAWQADIATQESFIGSHLELDVYRDPTDDIEGFDSDVINDQPKSFDPHARRYASRGVYRDVVKIEFPIQQSRTTPISGFFALAQKVAEAAS
jgi:CRISPR system Cascade subunit CasD